PIKNDPALLPFGLRDASEQNADTFLAQIERAGVEFFDLRPRLRQYLKNNYAAGFYRSDLHWTSDICLWAGRAVAEQLRVRFGFLLDETQFLRESYTAAPLAKPMLGPLGKTTGQSYSGTDVLQVLTPRFATDFDVYLRNGRHLEGTMAQALLNRAGMEALRRSDLENVYNNYVYTVDHLTNRRAPNQKRLLFVSESFGIGVFPYMALAAREVRYIDWLRSLNTSLPGAARALRADAALFLLEPYAVSTGVTFHFAQE
ncbi:MAG: hypothetical protein LBB50_05530, partial [Oscillospiraceae bacterium]|nr:hypothetical protein [Oscillospiraceae bacterium]